MKSSLNTGLGHIFDAATAGVDIQALQDLYGMVEDLPRGSRGRKHAMRAVPTQDAFEMAARYVDAIAVDEVVVQWMGEDHPKRLETPPTEAVTPRNLLVGSFACAFAGLPTSWTDIYCALTTKHMTRRTRALLGFPVSEDPAVDKKLDARRRRIAYSTVAYAGKRVGATIDPRPFPTKKALTREQADAIDRARDPVQMARCQRRGEVLMGITVVAQFQALPDAVKALWGGDLSADQTILPTWGEWGHFSVAREDATSISPDVLSGLHVKETDQRDKVNEPGSKPKVETTHGQMATFALMVNGPGEPVVPPLILGFGIDTPGLNPGVNLASAIRAIVDSDLPVGRMTVDLGYSQQFPENYAFLMLAMGYRLMHMFKETELGKNLATWGGLSVVEGRVYGPCLPDDVRYAVRDFKRGDISEDLFQARMLRRPAFEARLKAGKDGKQGWVFRCPGMGKGRTADCTLQPATDKQQEWEARVGRTLPLIVTQPERPPACCTNTASVSVPAKKFARYVTDVPYRTDEFNAYYRAVRNQMEGRNGFVKNPLGANIAQAGQRRMRGIGRQILALLPKVVAANFQAICTWIDDEEDGKHLVVQAPKTRGRPRSPGLEEYRPDPNGPPLKIVGPAIKPLPDVA